MAEGSGTKGRMCCSIKFLVKMKNVSLFLLKNPKTLFGLPNTNSAILKTFVHSFIHSSKIWSLCWHGWLLGPMVSVAITQQ